MGTHSGSFTAKAVAPHASVFLRLEPEVVSGPGVRHCAETQPPCSVITAGREHHLCAALDKLLPPVRLHCPTGTLISNPEVHWGAPTGSCSRGYEPSDGCGSNSSVVSEIVRRHCAGRQVCYIRSEEFLPLLGKPEGEVCERLAPLMAEGCAADAPGDQDTFLRFASTYECLPEQATAAKTDDQSADSTWTRGNAAVLTVDLQSASLAFSLRVGAETWLSSAADTALAHCGGTWLTPSKHEGREHEGRDSIGAFESLEVTSTTPSSSFLLEFRYYTAADAFRFITHFPSGCPASALPAADNPPVVTEYNASSRPLSLFPSFDASASSALGGGLGWFSWQGRFSMDGTAHGLSGLQNDGKRVAHEAGHADRFVGGSTGGPLMLFDAAEPGGSVLVLTPSDSFFDSIISFNRQKSALQLGVQGKIQSVPAGANVSFLLSPSGSGVNAAMQKAGGLLQKMHNTSRPRPCGKVGDGHSGCERTDMGPENGGKIKDFSTQTLGLFKRNFLDLSRCPSR